MAFVESDRVNIRQYLGYSGTFLQLDPRLERAITTVQQISDGGTRPDTSTEVLVKALVVKLQAIDTALDNLDGIVGVGTVGEINIDTVREMARLRAKGRIYVFRLAVIFDTQPRSDCFSSAPPADSFPASPFRSGY